MSKGTVLIADDDKAIRTVLVQALGRVGFDVKATGTASSLWKWVSNGEGDVIVTDVMMPDQNAFDLIPRIRRLRPDLPIIVISAIIAPKAVNRGVVVSKLGTKVKILF